ncbi:putative hotdog family 3-hydroxylacyl-ACP dehydratase [Hymenobacter sp. UYAg731]
MPDSFPTLAPGWAARPLVGPANVTAYIPQRVPFVLIDTLYQCGPGQAWAGLLVPDNHLMVQQGYLSEAGILESMAQAVALKSGYEACAQAAGTPPRVGFIAALKAVQIHALAPVSCTLVTHVEVLLQALDVLVVKTSCGYNTTPVAQCEMRLFLETALPAQGVVAPVVAVPSDYA